MFKYLFFIVLCTAFSFDAVSQTYSARVFKCDAERVAVFQASYTVLKDGVLQEEGKTYFDGGLSVNCTSKSKYKIIISYPGYKDTTLVFIPKNLGKTNTKIDTVCLQKNGMRLFGRLMDVSQDLPIKGAVLILKNVMTRSEVIHTTELDGYFNFRLEFETNYQLKVDKYSPGILNKYQDTSFYISTIGFTLPLDFKLDVFLSKARGYTTPREVSYSFDSSKIKPVLAVKKSEDFLSNNKDSISARENAPIAQSNVEESTKLDAENVQVLKTVEPIKIAAVVNEKRDTSKTMYTENNKSVKMEKLAKVSVSKEKVDTPMRHHAEKMVSAKKEKVAKVSVSKEKTDTPMRHYAEKVGPSKKEKSAKKIATKETKVDTTALAQKEVEKKEPIAKKGKSISAIDSASLRESQVMEARKRIEEQNKVLYEKKKRDAYEATQKDLIAYYEKKLKSANANSTIELAPKIDQSEKIVQPKSTALADIAQPKIGKVMLYGNIYNASNQLKLSNVTISARPINSIFSKELQTDEEGNFKIEVDSGQIFVLSFFKNDFKISKQLVDLSEKMEKLIKIQDVYLSENIDVEISKDMPVLYFEKNKSELSESITEELEALSVLLRGNKSYSIRLIGLAASDETFTKPLSTSRVSQVAQYLVSAKVTQEQIKFTSLGDTKRRSNCGFNKPCTTQDYNNDRVVVYIISQSN